jgi:hypothetical protein
VREADRARADGVAEDRRQVAADVVQRLDEGQRATEDTATAGDAGGRGQDQPADAFGPLGRQLGGEQAAERVPDHVDAVEPGGVEPAPEPGRDLAGGEAPESRQLDQVEPVLPAEQVDQRCPPTPRSRQAVDEQERVAGAGEPIPHRHSVDLELGELHVPQSGTGLGSHALILFG